MGGLGSATSPAGLAMALAVVLLALAGAALYLTRPRAAVAA
ncbi:hypothetical protein [Streptomyces sp. NPDC048710]